MTVTSRIIHFAAACLALTLAACGGGGDAGGGAGGATTVQTRVIAATGGTVTASGATLSIPAGALSQDTTISVSISNPIPNLPQSPTLRGMIFDFGPNGTTFRTPATLTLPLVGTPAANERAVIAYLDPASNQWVDLPSTVTNGSISAPLTHFTVFAQRFTGLDPGLPERNWSFDAKLGDGTMKFLSGSTQIFGTLNATIDFGPAFNDQPIVIGNGLSGLRPSDEIATGQIFSSEFGGTFFVSAEAPSMINLVADSPIGNHVRLIQLQSFVRDSENASLTFEVTNIVLEATDLNDATNLSFAECPTTPCPDLISAMVALRLEARTDRKGIIYDATGIAQVRGDSRGWTHSTDRGQYFCPDSPNSCRSPFFGTIQLWNDGSVVRTFDPANTFIRLQLKEALPFSIDLANVLVDETVTLEIVAVATTVDRRAGSDRRSSAYAYLRDPRSVGGMALTATGLRATSRHVPALPIVNLLPPALCVAGPDPAGTLQFSAASYSLAEWAGGEQAEIRVTRTGGSSGATSATFSTSDATAIAGADYTPVQMTVAFADGDAAPKILIVPIIHDGVAEPDKTLSLTLPEPGGCVTLGAQASAELTIFDDDRAPPPSFTIGGTLTGLAGTGLVLNKLGEDLPIAANGAFTFKQAQSTGFSYSVTVITQPTNPLQLCTVTNGSGPPPTANITNIAVNCVTPTANGALDPSFGDAGKVSIAFGGDETAMALQADGKIVMAGGSGSDFVLARYNVDGSLDTGFGSAGTVTTDIASGLDEAHGVAIQGDGKIVVVGQAVVGRTTNNQFNFDFALARYNADGSLDTSFGTGGKVTTDFNVLTDQAFAVAIQGDGKIVVVGNAGISIQTNGFTATDFGIARYNSNGTLDASFGSGGKVTTDIAGGVDLARNIVLQGNDVAVLVSGSLTIGSSASLDHTGLARYDTNGVLDGSFGTGGKLTLIDKRVDEGLVLQGDGKILLAGSVSIGIFPARSSQFALMRLTANGGPDNGFGTAGLVTTPFSTLDDFGRAVALQADGRILVAGQRSNQSNPDFAVARYATNGTLDGSFGTGGKLTIDFFGSSDSAENVIVQPDGRIVLGGFARNGTRTGYGLARVLP